MNRQSVLLRAARGTLNLFVRLVKGVFALLVAFVVFFVRAVSYAQDHQSPEDDPEYVTPLKREVRREVSEGYF